MSDKPPLLLEIGCEEIPARMIAAAAADLARRVSALLEAASLDHGPTRGWGGSRRLAVRVEAVQGRQADRRERVLGPPASVALDDAGNPGKAAIGFARKQGIEPGELTTFETERGLYLGFERETVGRSLEQVLAEELPAAVAAMSFPKTMRWGDGGARWVRPVHWVLALHGAAPLSFALFDVQSGATSHGHRFLSKGPVHVSRADLYGETLERARVVVDPQERRRRLLELLRDAAEGIGGRMVEDEALVAEAADLVEWPGVVAGRFDGTYLALPRELLVTTLRHHQKCFSVEGADGSLLAAFLAVANTRDDPAGHIRRGNEWVVGGRLDDARFFWREDRKRSLESRSEDLAAVVFHARLGSYADKARRMARLATGLARRIGLEESDTEHCHRAALLAKNDLVTGTVGEFPELQGRIGGLLHAADVRSVDGDRAVRIDEGDEISQAIYDHYLPSGPDDDLPRTDVGAVVSVADKLDSLVELVRVDQAPTGSRDPFGLRRAGSGVFRIVIERQWPLALRDLQEVSAADSGVFDFVLERLRNYLRERGSTANEIDAVFRPRVSGTDALEWPLHDVVARLEAIGTVREREDFAHLVDLTKRVDNILTKDAEKFRAIVGEAPPQDVHDDAEAAVRLAELVSSTGPRMESESEAKRYGEVVELLSGLIAPVETFFVDCLVMDPANPRTTASRWELLRQLRRVLTTYFDIRELAGQADRRE